MPAANPPAVADISGPGLHSEDSGHILRTVAAPERAGGCGKHGDSMQTVLSSWHCHLE